MNLGEGRNLVRAQVKRGLATALAVALVSAGAIAEEALVTKATEPQGKIIGNIDLRPSLTVTGNKLYTEDTVELGYEFSPGRSVSVVQYFETNLLDPAEDGQNGISPTIYDTFLRAKVGKILEDKENGLSFGYQNRTYLPVSENSRAQGMIATFRNYLTVSKTLGSSVKLTLSELPIFPVYSQAGANGKANPAFENRIYLIGDIDITEKLSVSIPLLFWATAYRSFDVGAKNNAKVNFMAMIYPEVTYMLTDNVSVGVAYWSGNLVAADLSGFTMREGLESGVVQAVLGASL